MDDLEATRQANIQRNTHHLGELGILLKPIHARPLSSNSDVSNKPPPPKRRKLEPLPPSRSSARIASAPARPDYNEDSKKPTDKRPGNKATKAIMKKRTQISTAAVPANTASIAAAAVTAVAGIPLQEIEALRARWTSWTRTAPPPTQDEEDSTFHFADHPTFTPNKSPEAMLREGCFGGSYFRPLYSRSLGATIADDHLELPPSWTAGLPAHRFLTSPHYDPDVNKYKVKCGQSIEEWEAAGWIAHEHDVRGWFQWYCRFFQGRRCEDDERQVSRWRKCVGETGRWRRMLLKRYRAMGVKEVFDDGEDEDRGDVSPVMHQTCFQWAYEVRQKDLDRFWQTGT